MSSNVLYTDLSAYYDLLCVDIDYESQSDCVRRLDKIFGNGGLAHLDLGCGTGPHVRAFTDFGYQSNGLDINQAMLDIAQTRCPEANFSLQNMSDFIVDEPVDLITCFLYSIHYNDGIANLKQCIANAHRALKPGGVFCFNVVDKDKIDNDIFVKHTAEQNEDSFSFRSAWSYSGQGERKTLKLRIEKTRADETLRWDDEHSMVAVNFDVLTQMLQPYFEVHIFEHDYESITQRNSTSGNAIFTCVKI